MVTSNYHARRTRFIYGKVLPPGIVLRVSAARDSEFDPLRWWETRQGQKLFLSELAGYLVARWELQRRPVPENQIALLISRAPADGGGRANGRANRREVTPASPRPYLIGNTPRLRGSPLGLCAYYSSQVTVFSGLPWTLPSLAVTEFTVGGKNVA